MNKLEFIAIEQEKNRQKFGRWASTKKVDSADEFKFFTEKAPSNKDEALQHGNALAATGNYPVGTSDCFNVGISGGCGTDCFVYQEGRCGEPQEMIPGLTPAEIVIHLELYPQDKQYTKEPA